MRHCDECRNPLGTKQGRVVVAINRDEDLPSVQKADADWGPVGRTLARQIDLKSRPY